jgi:hypothetical protein
MTLNGTQEILLVITNAMFWLADGWLTEEKTYMQSNADLSR